MRDVEAEGNDAKFLCRVEEENRRWKQMVAEQVLDIPGLKAITVGIGSAQDGADGRIFLVVRCFGLGQRSSVG